MKTFYKYLALLATVWLITAAGAVWMPANGTVWQKVTSLDELSTGDEVILTNRTDTKSSGASVIVMIDEMSGSKYSGKSFTTTASNRISTSNSDNVLVLTIKFNSNKSYCALCTKSTESGGYCTTIWLQDPNDGNNKLSTTSMSSCFSSISVTGGSSYPYCWKISTPTDQTKYFYPWELQNAAVTSRYLRYNTGFCSSSTTATTAELCIWKKACTTPTVAFTNSNTYTVNFGGAAPTGRTATVTYNSSSTGQTITYTSSTPAVASVNKETGAITMGTLAGSTTITATAAANDTYCEATATYTITVNAVAPTVTFDGGSVTASSSTTATFTGGKVTATGGKAITEYGWVYSKTNETPTISDSKSYTSSSIALNTAFSAKTITGLDDGTTYYVRAYAYNGSQYGYSSEVKQFTTPVTQYTITYNGNTNTSGTAPTAQTVDKNTTITLPNQGTLAKTGYKFMGWLEGSTSGTQWSVGYSHTVTGNLTFYAKWCGDMTAQGSLSPTATAPTWVTSGTITGAWKTTVSWTAFNDATYHYELKDGASIVHSGDQTNTTITFDDLASDKTYTFTVYAKNTCSATQSSTESTTIETVCAALSAPTITASPSMHSATIKWECDGAVLYDFSLSPSVSGADATGLNVTERALTGLTEETAYTVTLKAYNNCGKTITRDDFTFKTTAIPTYDKYTVGCATLNFTSSGDADGKQYVTSSIGQQVRVTYPFTVSGSGLTPNTTVKFTTGTDLDDDFIVRKADGTELTTDENGAIAETSVYVFYKPSDKTSNQIDGIVALSNETYSFTASVGGSSPASTKLEWLGNIYARHLPAEFVIAAKAGSGWIALTANIKKMGTQDGVPIIVDNQTEPTKAAVAMNTAEYGLQQLYTAVRRTENGTAVYLVSEITNKALNATKATSKTEINTGAQPANAAASDSCLFYEWKLTTTDLIHYTITNCNTKYAASNGNLGYSTTYGKWGMYTSGNANQELFLLPIERELTDLQVEVMEWGTDAMALRFNGDVPNSVNVQLGSNSWTGLTLEDIGAGSDIKKLSGLDLTTNDCEVLLISDVADNGTLIRKPIIVANGEKKNNTDYSALGIDACANCDIVVLQGGELVANSNKSAKAADIYGFANIYVYPGGKLTASTKSIKVQQQLYARGGYSWLNTTSFKLPSLYLNNCNFTGSAKIIYDYYIKPQVYYQCALPYPSQLSKITDEVGIDNFPSWLKHYNGALRAADPYATSWEWYYGEDVTIDSKTVTGIPAGKGFIIAAMPRQEDKVKNRPLAIIRFPLGNNAFSGTGDHADADVTATTTAHGIDGYNATPRTVTANNVGWNFLGNPFMSPYRGEMGHKLLEKEMNGANWTGAYVWSETDANNYITIMSAEDGQDYGQYIPTAYSLPPFFPFYMQETASGGSGELTFLAANRQNEAAAVVRAAPALVQKNANRKVYVLFNLQNEQNDSDKDVTGLILNNSYSDELDFNDLEKQFGASTASTKAYFLHDETRLAYEAMQEQTAETARPLGYRAPVAGYYTLSLDAMSNLSEIEHVYLNDLRDGVYDFDLMLEAYEFYALGEEYADTRFTVRVVLREEKTDTPTAIEDVSVSAGSLADLHIVSTNGGIMLQGLPADAQVWIYDMTGKMLLGNGQPSTVHYPLPQGVYNVRVVAGTEARTIRAIVK